MLITILLGIATSMIAEVVAAINKKLSNTPLKGDGAFLVAFALALIGSVAKEVAMPGFTWSALTDWGNMSATFSEVFAVSQVYFLFVVKKLNLDIQPHSLVGEPRKEDL